MHRICGKHMLMGGWMWFYDVFTVCGSDKPPISLYNMPLSLLHWFWWTDVVLALEKSCTFYPSPFPWASLLPFVCVRFTLFSSAAPIPLILCHYYYYYYPFTPDASIPLYIVFFLKLHFCICVILLRDWLTGFFAWDLHLGYTVFTLVYAIGQRFSATIRKPLLLLSLFFRE